MKLNNKGMSLMELLVTLVLIGIVLTFIFGLLVDIRNERDNNNFAQNNQINRIEIMHKVGDDLNKYTLESVREEENTTGITLKFKYRNPNGTKDTTLRTYSKGTTDKDYYVEYTDYSGEKTTWKMNGAEIDSCGHFTFYKDNASDKYYFKINIYLYNDPAHERNNKEKNNAVDDIEITYAGFKRELLNEGLTNEPVDKQIGKCTN